MVFAIGWSNVSVASVKIMHINMQTQMSQDHCLDQTQKITEHSSNHQVKTGLDCHNELASLSNQHNKDCQECSSLSCQIQLLGLDSSRSPLAISHTFHCIAKPNFSYSNQYLNGYWQEILRPPKT